MLLPMIALSLSLACPHSCCSVAAPGLSRYQARLSLRSKPPGQAGVLCCVPLAGSQQTLPSWALGVSASGFSGSWTTNLQGASVRFRTAVTPFPSHPISPRPQGLVSLRVFTLYSLCCGFAAVLWVCVSTRINELEIFS